MRTARKDLQGAASFTHRIPRLLHGLLHGVALLHGRVAAGLRAAGVANAHDLLLRHCLGDHHGGALALAPLRCNVVQLLRQQAG